MIRRFFAAAAAVSFATPALAGPFDGTWKADPSTFKASTKPYTRLLANGHYHCTCSNPPEDFDVDGKFHPTPGHTAYDEAKADILSPTSVHFAYRLKGRPMFEVTSTLSGDGKTTVDNWTDTSTPHPVTGSDEEIRIGAAPAGAHALSGVWRDSDKTTLSAAGVTTTLAQTGDMLRVTNSDGTSFVAVIGGPYVKIAGSATGTMVSVARSGPRTLAVSFKRDGKIVERDTWAFSPDMHSVKVSSTYVQSDRTISMVAFKQ